MQAASDPPESIEFQPGEDDLDDFELGTRAGWWLLMEELGASYSSLNDREWAVAVGCYRKCVTSLGAGNVPAGWRPVILADGRWTGDRRG